MVIPKRQKSNNDKPMIMLLGNFKIYDRLKTRYPTGTSFILHHDGSQYWSLDLGDKVQVLAHSEKGETEDQFYARMRNDPDFSQYSPKNLYLYTLPEKGFDRVPSSFELIDFIKPFEKRDKTTSKEEKPAAGLGSLFG